jgi:hypothetical protein
MTDNPLHGRFDEMLDTFLLKPESTPSATYRVADLYSGTGEISEAVREVGLDVVWRHQPDDRDNPDFAQIPDFDILTATLPDDQRAGLERALRFLRVRRPWAFVLVGEEEDAEFLWRLQDKTHRLGYEINRTSGDGLAFLIGTLGRDLPVPSDDPLRESLIESLVRICADARREFGEKDKPQ